MPASVLPSLRHPFGEESCEAEVRLLRDRYSEFYFDETPFNRESLRVHTYLLVGRRGTGKTSLSQFFKFQQHVNNARCIDVDEPQEYERVLAEVAAHASHLPNTALLRIVKIWKYVLWSLLFEEFRQQDLAIAAACVLRKKRRSTARTVLQILRFLLNRFLKDEAGEIADDLEDFIASPVIRRARQTVLGLTQRTPVIIAIDTLEQYHLDNEPLMLAIAGLIQCASEFNTAYASRGVHVKAFVSAEIFPHIEEQVIPNSAKHIRQPLYLHWRPKDLVRLACWRWSRHLEQRGLVPPGQFEGVQWNRTVDVLEKVWYAYVGRTLVNGHRRREPSFPFVLRHTQMRPRQMVILCNEIARQAADDGVLPHLSQTAVHEAVSRGTRRLAVEVINAYAQIQPNVALIVDALRGLPASFRGNRLDKAAHTTKSDWLGGYSAGAFRRLVAELGIVGRVRRRDPHTGIIEASFEHSLEGRLVLRDTDECAIHPMFYRYLETATEPASIVYPFPDHARADEALDQRRVA